MSELKLNINSGAGILQIEGEEDQVISLYRDILPKYGSLIFGNGPKKVIKQPSITHIDPIEFTSDDDTNACAEEETAAPSEPVESALDDGTNTCAEEETV